MSAVVDTHAHATTTTAIIPRGIMRWVTTTNHKDIGTMYLWFSFTMFMVGGVMALIIRAELFQPGLQIVNPEFFNQMTTMHGLIMVFGAIMPAFVGFANWLIPMMIGAPDMAFPRMNNWSFWLLPPAALAADRSRSSSPGGGAGRGLDAVCAAHRCRWARAWTSRSSRCTSSACRRSWARSTSSPPSSTCARRA